MNNSKISKLTFLRGAIFGVAALFILTLATGWASNLATSLGNLTDIQVAADDDDAPTCNGGSWATDLGLVNGSGEVRTFDGEAIFDPSGEYCGQTLFPQMFVDDDVAGWMKPDEIQDVYDIIKAL